MWSTKCTRIAIGSLLLALVASIVTVRVPTAAQSDVIAARAKRVSDADDEPNANANANDNDSSANDKQLEESLVRQLPPSVGEGFSCHLRSVDLCAAGVMARAQAPMPANEQQIDVLCEDLQTAMDCVAAYNARCQTMRVFGNWLPVSALDGAATSNMPFCYVLDGDAEQRNRTEAARRAMLKLSPCINAKFDQLRGCFHDLQAALTIFYEPGKPMPTRPLCCAYDRFRRCASKTIDTACGLGSFEQLQTMIATMIPTRTIQFVCKRATGQPIKLMLGNDLDTMSQGSPQGSRGSSNEMCEQLLPPAGTPVPTRRGKKASKLARILGLFAAAPASAPVAA